MKLIYYTQIDIVGQMKSMTLYGRVDVLWRFSRWISRWKGSNSECPDCSLRGSLKTTLRCTLLLYSVPVETENHLATIWLGWPKISRWWPWPPRLIPWFHPCTAPQIIPYCRNFALKLQSASVMCLSSSFISYSIFTTKYMYLSIWKDQSAFFSLLNCLL